MSESSRRGQYSNRTRSGKAVAERSGVSLTTVSRVLNGQDDAIPESTRERVIAAARELGYRPNSLAAALRKGVSRTIGLVVPDISDAYFHQVARGVEDVAQPAGYMVVFCNTDRVAEKELACVQLLDDKRADAIIFAGGGIGAEKHLVDYPWESIPTVTIGPHRLPVPSIRVNDSATIQTAVEHLLDGGCRRILCIAGQSDWLITESRLDGYNRALTQAGLSVEPGLVVHGEFSQVAGHDAVDRVLSAGIEFDGVVAFNDYLAIGAIGALHRWDRGVPEDVAVIGCDDIPLASLAHPGLSSISFPQYEFGRQAMRTVLDMVAGNEVEEEILFPYHLEVRASTRRTVDRPL